MCWYPAMAALLIAGLLTGRREFFLLLFIMGFVLLFSLALNLWTLLSFSYVQRTERRVCVKGGETSLRVEIYNDKPFPFAFMRVTVAPVARSSRVRLSFSLLPRSHASFTVPLFCPYRGVFGVGMTELEVNDSFGLVRTRFNMLSLPYYRQTEMKVYPRLADISLPSAKRTDAKVFGSTGAHIAKQGESYAGLSKYTPGDPFKRVHRAVSAKRRELYVKTYDAPFETSVLIAMDTAVGGGDEEERLYLADLACECAAAVAHYSLRTGRRVIFGCAALPGAPDVCETERDFLRFYEGLAELRFTEQGDFAEVFQRISYSDVEAVYAITARSDAVIREVLSMSGIKNIRLIELSTGKGAEAAAESASVGGVWTVRLAVGDDIAAVLGEESVMR